jgi:hypothetical protein
VIRSNRRNVVDAALIEDGLLDYVASARLNYHDRGEGLLFPTLRRDPRGRLNTDANTIIMGACGVRSNRAAAASPIRCPGSTAGGISSGRASRTRGVPPARARNIAGRAPRQA